VGLYPEFQKEYVTMHWTQAVMAIALAVYLGSFLVIVVAARRAGGESPLGDKSGHPLGAAVTLLASVMLLFTAGAYVLDAQTLAVFGHLVLLGHPVIRSAGVLALSLAAVLLIWAEVSIGGSFRMALPTAKQPLVTHGIYGIIRNPMALSVDLLALGVLFLAPSCLALVVLVLNTVAYEWKVRTEESYLRAAHGPEYEAYCVRTGKYLPRLF
jgi:protein-S-isoprenylcysteine O-methyltransferase Ste14